MDETTIFWNEIDVIRRKIFWRILSFFCCRKRVSALIQAICPLDLFFWKLRWMSCMREWHDDVFGLANGVKKSAAYRKKTFSQPHYESDFKIAIRYPARDA